MRCPRCNKGEFLTRECIKDRIRFVCPKCGNNFVCDEKKIKQAIFQSKLGYGFGKSMRRKFKEMIKYEKERFFYSPNKDEVENKGRKENDIR